MRLLKSKVQEVGETILPTKRRTEELIKLLKKHSTWDGVNTLDTYALAKIVKEAKWPKTLLEKLKEFEETERTESVYFRKIKREE